MRCPEHFGGTRFRLCCLLPWGLAHAQDEDHQQECVALSCGPASPFPVEREAPPPVPSNRRSVCCYHFRRHSSQDVSIILRDVPYNSDPVKHDYNKSKAGKLTEPR